jgi:hypothetical protein
MLLEGSPLSLELGVVDGEVVQAFRTPNANARRAIKNALRNVYPTSRLSPLRDDAFRPKKATSIYLADVALSNDLYAIKRWQQLLTQSDPLSTLLGALAVDEHASFFGHVSIVLIPLASKQLAIHRKAFDALQSDFMQNHSLVASIFERTARAPSSLLRVPAWLMKSGFCRNRQTDATENLGAARHHERETDVQSASNKLNSACFQVRLQIRVYGPDHGMSLASSLTHQIFSPLSQLNAPRLGQFRLSSVRHKRDSSPSRFLLSCQEVASIFHPPVDKTQTLATSRFVQLEPPKDLPISKEKQPMMKLGETCFHWEAERPPC